MSLVSLYLMVFIAITNVGADLLVCRNLTSEIIVQENIVIPKALRNRIKSLEEKVLALQTWMNQADTAPVHTTISGIPRDCSEIYRIGVLTDGVYTLSPDGRCPFLVLCDMTNGGWTLIQKRQTGKVNFYRSWTDYVAGFGDISGEHWLGLDKIHRLTQPGYQIYFDLENHDGSRDFAHYASFILHGSSTLYRMNVDKFGYNGSIPELFSYHDNMMFSTFDRDNDRNTYNCCEKTYNGGAWWYNSCIKLGNLNGVYDKVGVGGIGYHDWKKHIFVKNVQIKVKARSDVC